MTPPDRLDEVIAALRAALRGEVITPDHSSYDNARRVWNAMFDDRRPAAVLRCASERDVVEAVRLLRDLELPLAVRGGGHHIAGFGGCDRGFVIDLSAMRSATMAGDRVIVAGGATLHEVDTATSSVGRAVPLGVVSPTGVAGLTLSGGVGWLTRRHGYTCDNLLSARVVTAAGDVVTAGEDENADLLWGLRGGGGNFGVVTEFTFQTHPVDEVLIADAYHVVKDESHLESLLRFYRDWSGEQPNETTAWLVVERSNDWYNSLYEGATGDLVFGLLACCISPSDSARRALEHLTGGHGPVFARVSESRLVDLQHLQDDSSSAATGMQSYMKGEMLTELTDEAIAGIAHHCLRMPTPSTLFEMGSLGGAMGDSGELDAAVGLRDAIYLGGFSMMSRDGANLDENIAWTRDAWTVLRSGSAGGVYLNFSGDESEERILGSLGASQRGAKRERLIALKRRYDPDNFFRINHNIDPASEMAGVQS